jgi:uncharacterized protein DUF1269
LAPLLGAAVGGAAGALGGKLSQLGLDQLVVKDVLKAFEPGRATLFLLSDYADADHFAETLRPRHPSVIKTTLPEWEERTAGGGDSADQSPDETGAGVLRESDRLVAGRTATVRGHQWKAQLSGCESAPRVAAFQ